MKVVLFIAAVAVLPGQCLSACATTGTNTTAHEVDWPAIVHCTSPLQSDLLEHVEAVLTGDGPATQVSISDQAIADLKGLAQRHGPSTVACVVDEVVAELLEAPPAPEPTTARSTSAMSVSDDAAARRGADFLRQVGCTVEREGGGS